MIIQCSACKTRYHYDEARFAGAPAKKIRCTKCATVFEIRNPAAERPASRRIPARGDELHRGADARLRRLQLRHDGHGLAPEAARRRRRRRFRRPPPRRLARAPAPAPAPAPRDGHGRVREAAGRRVRRRGRAAGSGSPTGRSSRSPASPGPEAGRIFEIDKARVVIGRAGSDILLNDPECSRNHAAIEVSDDKVFLVDLGSTNGTYVADKRITQLELENRSEFDVGSTTLMLIRTRKE